MENYAGGIIASLASLPEFLRKPILKKRLAEFQTLPSDEQDVIIRNALEAGPQLPFDTFAKLFGTWLEALSEMPAEQRQLMLTGYAVRLASSPQDMVPLHTDGLLAVFLEADATVRQTLSMCIQNIIQDMEPDLKRRLLIMMPDSAKDVLGL